VTVVRYRYDVVETGRAKRPVRMRADKRMRQTNRRVVVAAVMLGTFLAALDTSIVGTAMPRP